MRAAAAAGASHVSGSRQEPIFPVAVFPAPTTEANMTFGRGALLWLIGIPLPLILLLAIFWR